MEELGRGKIFFNTGVFMSVLSGTTAILHCLPDSGKTTIMITWMADLLYDTSCLMSIGDTSSYSNCTERAIHKNLTLEILNTHITDTGNYTCELVTSTGAFFKSVILHVLVSPSVSLGTDSAGFPECRAVGGNPAAHISWIPESDNVTNSSEMDPNKTWTVISTYRASVISERKVTCIVSHPTFTQPETRSIKHITDAPSKEDTGLITSFILRHISEDEPQYCEI
ncbi:cell surface glycoprotein CD200 receptor 1-like [Pelodytes ibericus]